MKRMSEISGRKVLKKVIKKMEGYCLGCEKKLDVYEILFAYRKEQSRGIIARKIISGMIKALNEANF